MCKTWFGDTGRSLLWLHPAIYVVVIESISARELLSSIGSHNLKARLRLLVSHVPFLSDRVILRKLRGSELRGEAFVQAWKLLWRELFVAEWAVHFLRWPVFYAAGVKVVARVARKRRDHFSFFEITKAYDALFVLFEAIIELARHLIKRSAHSYSLTWFRSSMAHRRLSWCFLDKFRCVGTLR